MLRDAKSLKRQALKLTAEPSSAQSPTHQGACFAADGETISRHTAKRDG